MSISRWLILALLQIRMLKSFSALTAKYLYQQPSCQQIDAYHLAKQRIALKNIFFAQFN